MSQKHFRYLTGVVFAIVALSMAQVVRAAVWTDQLDYAPGSVVTISGDNSDGAAYAAGEIVDVAVSGPNGYAAACEAVVAEGGAWACTVTLWADDLAIGDYSYTATSASGVQQSGTFKDGRNGTTLVDASKTATGHWTRTFGWTIAKSVTPDTLNLFTGDSAEATYTVAVTRDDGTDAVWVDGQVCLTNGGAVATEGLAIADDLLYNDGGGFDPLTSAGVDVSANPVLDPGETGCYPYSFSFSPVAGAQYKNSARITILNHSGHLGEAFGPSPDSDSFTLGSPILINASVHVTDSNGSGWDFGDDGSESYTDTFSCNGDVGSHGNTATIDETGQSDDASVTVNCYALEVSKTAATSLDRTWTWTVDKSADQTALTLALGQGWLVNYTVAVDATSADSNWAAAGTIAIHNPAPMAATLTGVADVISDGILADTDCVVSFPYVLGAGETLNCTYSSALPDGTARTNTAYATLQNTPSGETDFTGTAAVDFTAATVTQIDECATVSDSLYGELGTACAGALPAVYTYSLEAGLQTVCGDHSLNNTATATGSDTGATASDSHTVTVTVPCGGCTLTPGYWKTHSENGPAPYDDAWALIGGSGTGFFSSGQSYYQVLWTAPQGGNAYYILAHAYIAAYLNQVNGASTAAISSQLTQAATLLASKTPAQAALLKNSARAQWINLAAALDAYNNGVTGPGHCSE